jgi:hypothetical protein
MLPLGNSLTTVVVVAVGLVMGMVASVVAVVVVVVAAPSRRAKFATSMAMMRYIVASVSIIPISLKRTAIILGTLPPTLRTLLTPTGTLIAALMIISLVILII